MKPHLIQNLFGEFPRLLIDLCDVDLRYTPNGWHLIIRRMLQEIEEEAIKQGADFRAGRWPKILSIAEDVDGDLEVCLDDPDAWDMTAFEASIAKATEKAKFICSECGHIDLTLPTKEVTLCQSCKERPAWDFRANKRR